jgi:KaiC/GvpD/RAD55 family RecA-like ATPase
MNQLNNSVSLTTLDHAIALGKAGYKVFPIIENGRIPAVGGWQQRATSDEAAIRKMWTEHDPVLNTTRVKNYNIGVYTKDLLVLDVDVKNGKKGLQTLAELDTFEGVPETFTVETASGGLHLYFRPENPVANSAGRIGDGLDIRGDGGYVVAAGSVIDGRQYTVKKMSVVAEAPAWLEQAAGAPAQRTSSQKQVVELLDTAPALQRARAALEDAAPAIEGQNGDHHTFKVAAKLKDIGVSELAALQLMLEHWNDRCVPPWDHEGLARKVSNAYHYGKQPVGVASAQADFEAVPQAEDPFAAKAPERPRLYRRKFGDIKPRLTDTYLVQKLLGEGAMSVVYGESNVGKTFFAMSLAYAIAQGRAYGGHKATQGAVVYVAAEAGVSAENRVAALRAHFKDAEAPFDLVPCPVDLLRPNGDTKALIELVKEAEADYGKVRLVVIDTLSRAIAGGNENSPDDMGALVKHLDALRVATRAHVMVIHHSGKDTAKGARGHSLLRAATDTEIEIQAGVARITKQRDMEMGASIGFDLVPVDLGVSDEGEKVTSCVAVPISEAQMEFGGDPDRINLVVEALRAAVEANKGRPVSTESWTAVCQDYINHGIIRGSERVKNDAFLGVTQGSLRTILMRLRNTAQQNGMVKKNAKNQWVVA